MSAAKRIIVVTGANKGIGLATTEELCRRVGDSAVVYLTARDTGRGQAAVEGLAAKGLTAVFHQLDVEDKASIATLASHLKVTHGGLDVLVNNAGFAYKAASTAPFAEQAEVTVGINYYGLQAVCHALFPLLRDHARVVNVSSCVGFLPHLPGEALKASIASDSLTEAQLDKIMADFVEAAKAGTHEQLGWKNSAYQASKVGASALSRIQQRVLDADASRTDLVVNHCHPGYVDTDMTSHKGPLTVEQGSVASVYLALLPPNITSPRGDFIWHDKTIVDWVNGPTPSRY